MKTRELIVAVVVLAALTGTLYWSNHHKSTETAPSTADVPPKILSLNESDISGIAINKKDAAEIQLTRNGNDWQITAPQAFQADQSAATGMVAALANLDAQRLVEKKASDLGQFGLATPVLTIGVHGNNNKTQQLLLGDAAPTGNAVYAKLEGDPRVFTIASFTKTSLDKSVNDLRDKRLITATPDKISHIELATKGGNIEFGRDKEQWQILKPRPMRADGSQVDDLVSAVTGAKMDLNAGDDSQKAAAAFASGAPVGSVKITTGSGSQELQLRKVKDDYYAKTSIANGFYKVTGNLGPQFEKKLDDFRNKKLFDFGFGEPSKIEMHDAGKAYYFTRSGEDWWSADGKKLEPDAIEELVGKLRDVQATRFADSGFGSPILEITVISTDGKAQQEVLIAKASSGNAFVARRQNDSTLYVLAESTITDLQKLAATIKPVATPKK